MLLLLVREMSIPPPNLLCDVSALNHSVVWINSSTTQSDGQILLTYHLAKGRPIELVASPKQH